MATRQLAAIMFTDMVGYTALMQENEQLALEKRRRNKTIFEESLNKYHGTLLQHYGDGTLSINSSAVNAILSAIEMQTLSRQEKIDMRIGLHIGEILKDENGIYGDSVNVASRIESLAVPGSIFISEKLYDDVKNHESIHAKLIGYFDLKNVKQTVQVYAVSNAGIVVPSRDEVKGKVKELLNSIAVLPFASLSSDPENMFFCDGMTEELLNVLSRIDGLQVTSRTSSFAFKDTKEDIREIAAKLNVKKILEGSVRKSGNKVRITVQLINAADGYHLWSESYDRNFEDIFELQDDISRNIANKLRSNLSSSDHAQQLVSVPTENMEAYRKYMQGMHYRNIQNMDAVMKSMQSFHEALALDPNFINPLFSIVEMNTFFTDAGIIGAEQAARICGDAAKKSMQIDPMNALSQLIAGVNAFYFEWDWVQAKSSLEKAIEINPNLVMAHIFLSRLRLVMQQKDLIEEPLRNAYHLDPMGGLTLGNAGEISFLAGKFDLALDYLNEALSIDPNNSYAEAYKSFVIGFSGDWDKTVQMLLPIYHQDSEFNFAIAYFGYAYAKSGQFEKARELIFKLEEKQKIPESPPLHHLLALLYLAIGDKERFYECYEESMRRKIIYCLYYYKSPLLIEVEGEERLMKLRRDYGLPA